jgi:hypothetical protein
MGKSRCCRMRLRMSIDRAYISFSVADVLDSHGVASGGGVGDQSTTLSFESTRSGLYGTRPAPLETAIRLSFVITLSKEI